MIKSDGVKGKKIAFLSNISHKKGPMLLIQAFKAIHEWDNEYTLHIGGAMQDPRYAVYFDHTIPELGLQDSIYYYGSIKDVDEWLTSFDYIICTSPLEGCPVGILEALSHGLTPLIYSFVGASGLYPPDFIWKTFPELFEILKKGPQNPEKYKKFVEINYSLASQLEKIGKIVDILAENTDKHRKIDKKGTISAVIAVKNGEKTVGRALQSLIDQSMPLNKIIVVNDGSTDGTGVILQDFMANNEIPIDIITLTQSKWVFSARNEGFKYVDTDYFFFLDADDWVESTYVEKASAILDENSSVDVVYPNLVYFGDSGVEQVYTVPEFEAKLLVQRNFVAYSSMQRASVFKEIGGYSDYMNDCRNHLTEWELWFRYMQTSKGFKRLGEPLFHYYNSGDEQMSKNYERSRSDMSLEMVMQLSDSLDQIDMIGDKKRIVLVCQGKDYCDRSQVGFELMTWYKPLEAFGEVLVFQYDVEMNHFGRDNMIVRLNAFLDLVKPAYVFHPSYKDAIPVDVWKSISLKHRTIVWNSDDDRRYASFTKEYNDGFRFAVTTYPAIYEEMDHTGKILSQWAANSSYFKPSAERTIGVSFVGQKYGNRQKLLDSSTVEIYGKGWPNGFVGFKEMCSILAKSKISISLAGGADGNKQLKLRTFEICASGALCLCEYTPGIEWYYEEGDEIVVFSTKEELVDLIEYYTVHVDEQEEIAQAGYDRTMKEHLWEHRFRDIFKQME